VGFDICVGIIMILIMISIIIILDGCFMDVLWGVGLRVDFQCI
jgi:hypothetical protein